MATRLFYIAKFLRNIHCGFLAQLIDWFIRYVCACEISSGMKIGKGLKLTHNGLGCVIHQGSIIGDNLTLHQNVTLGGREGSGLPVIGNNVMVGAGAVLLGDIKIGNNVKIGANAVVLCDVPDNCIAVGVPARIIYKNNEK